MAQVSEKTSKEPKKAKAASKIPASETIKETAKPKAAAATKPATKTAAQQAEAKKSDTSTSPATPVAAKSPDKPLITSNTDERGVSNLLWGLLMCAVLAGGGYATLPLWSPYVVDYLPELEMISGAEPPEDTLIDRISEIETEIKRVRESGEGIADLEVERDRMNNSIEGVMGRIAGLEKQIDDVRGMLQATLPPSDAVDTNESLQRLSSRMNKLEQSDETVNAVMERLAHLEQAMAQSGAGADSTAAQLSKTMAEISARIGSLESGVASSAAGDAQAAALSKQHVRAQTLVLAVGHLRQTLRSSEPFSQALDALKSLGEGDADIMRGVSELEPYAGIGIPTLDMLRREYATAADVISAAAPKPTVTNDTGVFDKALSRIKSLVSVRQVDSEASAGSAEGPAGTASVQLRDGDLAGAIKTLAALSGGEAQAAAPWLERARARLIAETTLSRLHVFVVSLLAPTGN